MTVPRGWPGPALVAVAAAGLAASLAANWPGHFPPDAIAELAQGRVGVFNLWHPPVTALLLGLADRISPDAAGFIVLQASLFYAALTAFAFTRRPGWPAVVAMAVLAVQPLALVEQGLVVKDVLFADASVAAFAAIAWLPRSWNRPAARTSLAALALILLVLAALVRQNGAVVTAVGCLTLAAVFAAEARPRLRGRTFLAAFAISATVAAGAVAICDAAFVARSDGQPEGARQWMTLQVYDLAGEVRRDPALPLGVLGAHAPGAARFVRQRAAPAYDVRRIDPILALPQWRALARVPGPWIGRQWRAVALERPLLWLRTRWGAFWQVLATPDVDACAPVLVGVDPGDPAMLAAAGLAARDTDKDDWDGDYASAWLHTPVYSHLAWGALALSLLVWALRDARRRPEMIAAAGLIAAAMAFSLSFFVISLACDYRYLYFLDVAAMAALVQRLSEPQAARLAASPTGWRSDGRTGGDTNSRI